MKQFSFILAAMLSLSSLAHAGSAGVITVKGTLTKITNVANTPCEGTPFQYMVTGDYQAGSKIKNFSSCFESVAVPLIGSQDHGGSPTGNLLTDATQTLEKYEGKSLKMNFTVYDNETLSGGLQTMLSIELRQ